MTYELADVIGITFASSVAAYCLAVIRTTDRYEHQRRRTRSYNHRTNNQHTNKEKTQP